MREYQRFLTLASKPFDPLELARETERIVTREGEEGLERKYVGIYSAPAYGGIATGYAIGCCLRCFYCWTDWSRDFPEKFGRFYPPRQVVQGLLRAAAEGIKAPGWERFRGLKVKKLRLSGCEPTLGREHLLSILEGVKNSGYLFILETNGILLGADRGYIRRLAEHRQNLYVRVSFKAATPEDFTRRTGARGEFYELPFKALRFLLNEGVYTRAAAMTDPRVMPKEEREILIKRLEEIDPSANYAETLEEETVDPYETSLARIKAYFDMDYARRLSSRFRRESVMRTDT